MTDLSRRTALTAVVGAVLSALSPTTGVFAATDIARPDAVIEVIVDNGGTVLEPEAQAQINDLIGGLANMPGREMSRARIDLILTSRPTTVWSGTRTDLIRQGYDVLDLVTLGNGCSDLARALRQAEQNIRVSGAARAYVLIHAPLIVAPFPCDGGPPITLPQPVPADLRLGQMLKAHAIAAFKVFGVHPSQERIWSMYLEREGVLALARAGALDFAFLGYAQSGVVLRTQALLRRGH